MRAQVVTLEDKVTALRAEAAEMSQTKESVQQILDALTQAELQTEPMQIEPMQIAYEELGTSSESVELNLWNAVLDLSAISKSSQNQATDEFEEKETSYETIQEESVKSIKLAPWDFAL